MQMKHARLDTIIWRMHKPGALSLRYSISLLPTKEFSRVRIFLKRFVPLGQTISTHHYMFVTFPYCIVCVNIIWEWRKSGKRVLDVSNFFFATIICLFTGSEN